MKPNNKSLFLNICASSLISIITFTISNQIPGLNISILFTLNFIFCYIFFKKSLSTSFIASIISLTSSYIFYILIAAISFPFFSFLFQTQNGFIFLNLITIIFICITQLLCVYFFFQIKRFQKGIPNFDEVYVNNVTVFISTTLLLMISLLNLKIELKATIIILILIFLSSMIVYFEFKKHVNDTYKKNLQTKNREHLEETIRVQSEELNILKTEVERLSKIIHKDNKLIPAMLFAVEDVNKSSFSKESSQVLLELKKLANERTGILSFYERHQKTLPKTNLVTLDAMFQYFLTRAYHTNIKFDLSLMGTLTDFIVQYISESDLRTLLADLIENALIATKAIENGSVLVTMDISNNKPSICIFDNGLDFEPKVIQKIGKYRYTTHLSNGGSGIGLIQTFELLNKYHASFELEEFTNHSLFQKKVAIIFDELSEIRIFSNRPDIQLACSKRGGITFQGYGI